MSIIKRVTLQKIVAHDFRYVPRITYAECVFVALVKEHAKSMRPTILPSVIFPALTYIFTFFFSRTARLSGKRLLILRVKCMFDFL